MSTEEIIKNYVFLTAGACGPCRFGMYVTEYRKALRDAGFDGFRVMLVPAAGRALAGDGRGGRAEDRPRSSSGSSRRSSCGDVLNAISYRVRPYEVEAGATDRAMEASKRHIHDALKGQTNIVVALWKVRREFSRVKVDKLRVKPKVGIIGEFWAMTTEGDGNYKMQKFLRDEGAEVDIQLTPRGSSSTSGRTCATRSTA
jgi:predicted nucleotide-binding protein (sugar kinase/HSP70/actin superfamily)